MAIKKAIKPARPRVSKKAEKSTVALETAQTLYMQYVTEGQRVSAMQMLEGQILQLQDDVTRVQLIRDRLGEMPADVFEPEGAELPEARRRFLAIMQERVSLESELALEDSTGCRAAVELRTLLDGAPDKILDEVLFLSYLLARQSYSLGTQQS